MNYCYTPVRYGPTPGKRAIVDSRRIGTVDYTLGDFLQRSDKREKPSNFSHEGHQLRLIIPRSLCRTSR
nr:MAG TPA: hypothetical protein [Caudoviricetes sp.]